MLAKGVVNHYSVNFRTDGGEALRFSSGAEGLRSNAASWTDKIPCAVVRQMPEGSPETCRQRQPGREKYGGDALDDIARIDVVWVKVTVVETGSHDMEACRL